MKKELLNKKIELFKTLSPEVSKNGNYYVKVFESVNRKHVTKGDRSVTINTLDDMFSSRFIDTNEPELLLLLKPTGKLLYKTGGRRGFKTFNLIAYKNLYGSRKEYNYPLDVALETYLIGRKCEWVKDYPCLLHAEQLIRSCKSLKHFKNVMGYNFCSQDEFKTILNVANIINKPASIIAFLLSFKPTDVHKLFLKRQFKDVKDSKELHSRLGRNYHFLIDFADMVINAQYASKDVNLPKRKRDVYALALSKKRFPRTINQIKQCHDDFNSVVSRINILGADTTRYIANDDSIVYALEQAKFKVTRLESEYDLVHEGINMNHCVGSMSHRLSNSRFYHLHKDGMDITCYINTKGDIKQCYRERNQNVPSDTYMVIDLAIRAGFLNGNINTITIHQQLDNGQLKPVKVEEDAFETIF